MKAKQIRLTLIVGIFALLGILFIQGFGLYTNWKYKEEKLEQSIWIALKETATELNELHNCIQSDLNPVHKINSTCFLVDVSCDFSPVNLVHSVKTSLNRHNINMEVALAQYNCSLNKIESLGGLQPNATRIDSTIQWVPDTLNIDEIPVYFFCINLAGKNTYLVKQMIWWMVLAVVAFLIAVFFSYTIFALFRQKHLAQLQKDFINNMTHEFKTPISSIHIAAGVISGYTEAPERYKNYIDLIKKENQRLNTQVEHVLKIARLDKGKTLYELDNLSLHQVISDLIADRHFADNVDIITKLNAVTDIVLADKMHLTNVIANLIDNGIKYNNNKPVIEIETRSWGNFMELVIMDNGIGIEKKYQKMVFDRFFRVPTGNIHDVKGFGLGLYYVRQVCKSMKWNIMMKSQHGKGTSFTLQFPHNPKKLKLNDNRK